MFNITTWFSQDIGFSQILCLVPLIVFFFFSHSKTVHYTGWCHCIFPPTAYDDSFSSRLSPEFIFLDLWWWPLWVVKFYFPLSFWLTFLQHLGNISIMSCGGDLHLFCFVFFFFFLKGYDHNLPLAVDFLKVSCVSNFSPVICPWTFL